MSEEMCLIVFIYRVWIKSLLWLGGEFTSNMTLYLLSKVMGRNQRRQESR
uniref:Uncharacterized protein n=1 Tax=Octopus bimaculoides TaxID=37653 RepID=A0A0L8HTT3_OCTBM